MKKTLLIAIISLGALAVGAQEEYTSGGDYSSEMYGGLIIHSNGWGVNFTKTKSIKDNKKWLFSADLVTMKHPKEEKRFNQNIDDTKRYVYGKTNYFMVLRPSIGRQRILYQKAEKRGIQVGLNYNLGLSLGLARPVYLIIQQPSSDGSSVESEEIYQPGVHYPDRIVGRASYFKGFSKTTIYPGIHAKFAINFDYAGANDLVRSIETGVAFDGYFKQVPLMAFAHNQRMFLTGYVALNFGKKQ